MDVMRTSSVNESYGHVIEGKISTIKELTLARVGFAGMVLVWVGVATVFGLISFGIWMGFAVSSNGQGQAMMTGTMIATPFLIISILCFRKCLRVGAEAKALLLQIEALKSEIRELEGKRSTILHGEVHRASTDLVKDLAGTADTKVCPSCAEQVKAAAKKCKHCGEVFA